jgi:GWxTD domain-containing protein
MSRWVDPWSAKRRGRLVSFTLACALASAVVAQEAEDRLSPEHRAWLEDEVAYIITERERDVFLSLETVEERDAFVEVFWAKRDPIVATLENEFKQEHYRRLEEADRLFTEIRSLPGRKTDRGRMLIKLGEPRSREEFDNYRELVTAELWFYQADPTKGLPGFFNLLFFKPQDVGVYRLYSPVIDGPGELLRGQAGAQRQLAFDNLYRISPELARASLTFDLAGPVNRADASAAMLGTELVMTRIEDSPKRAVNTDYLDGWLQYGNRVSAEYSFNFVPSRSTFAILLGADGTPFLNYAVELDFANFPVETDESQTRFYTTIDVNLEVRDPNGNLVLEDEKESYIELSRSQVQAMDGSSFSYQDSIPIVAGEYMVSVILRNRLLRQYTVAEANVRTDSGSPSMSDVVLGFSVDESTVEDASANDIVTFAAAGDRVHPATDGLFAVGDTAYVFVQVQDALPEHTLEIALLDGETVLNEQTVPAIELGFKPSIRLIRLTDMTGGRLEVRCELVDASGTALIRKSASMTVSPRTSVPRPAFTARRSFDAREPGLLALVLGDELWSLSRFDEARAHYEDAVGANNANLQMAKWKLAGAYVRERRAAEALELLVPLEPEFSQQYEVVLGLGLSYYLEGELEQAAQYLDRALTIRAPRTSLLNALADVYLKLGEPDKARPLLERSLKLDGSQEAIQETLSTLPTG